MFGMGKRPKPPAAAEKKPRAAQRPAQVTVTLKLAPAQRDKLELLGGEAWLREQIDRAVASSVFK